MAKFRHAVNGLGAIPIHNIDGTTPGVGTSLNNCFAGGERVSLGQGVEKQGDNFILRKCINTKCSARNIVLDIIVRPPQKN